MPWRGRGVHGALPHRRLSWTRRCLRWRLLARRCPRVVAVPRAVLQGRRAHLGPSRGWHVGGAVKLVGGPRGLLAARGAVAHRLATGALELANRRPQVPAQPGALAVGAHALGGRQVAKGGRAVSHERSLVRNLRGGLVRAGIRAAALCAVVASLLQIHVWLPEVGSRAAASAAGQVVVQVGVAGRRADRPQRLRQPLVGYDATLQLVFAATTVARAAAAARTDPLAWLLRDAAMADAHRTERVSAVLTLDHFAFVLVLGSARLAMAAIALLLAHVRHLSRVVPRHTALLGGSRESTHFFAEGQFGKFGIYFLFCSVLGWIGEKNQT